MYNEEKCSSECCCGLLLLLSFIFVNYYYISLLFFFSFLVLLLPLSLLFFYLIVVCCLLVCPRSAPPPGIENSSSASSRQCLTLRPVLEDGLWVECFLLATTNRFTSILPPAPQGCRSDKSTSLPFLPSPALLLRTMESEADDNELQFFLDESTSSFATFVDSSQIQSEDRFGARNPIANQLVKTYRNNKKHKRNTTHHSPQEAQHTLDQLEQANSNVKIYIGATSMKQQQQSYLVGSPSEQQQNIKRRRVHGELTSNNDFYSRFYNSSTSPTKTQGIRIEPPWLKNNNMYHNAMQQQSHSNSYVSSLIVVVQLIPCWELG